MFKKITLILMVALLPLFAAAQTVKLGYNSSDYANARGKPDKITKTEEFSECDCSCMAYDGGLCLMMKGNN